jgi:hypothetical protein
MAGDTVDQEAAHREAAVRALLGKNAPSVATSSPGFQSFKDLMQTVLLKTDFHRALDQTLAVGCQAATPTSVDFLSMPMKSVRSVVGQQP